MYLGKGLKLHANFGTSKVKLHFIPLILQDELNISQRNLAT